jgi:hypothetical protein
MTDKPKQNEQQNFIQKPEIVEEYNKIPKAGDKFTANEKIDLDEADILNGLLGYFDHVIPYANKTPGLVFSKVLLIKKIPNSSEKCKFEMPWHLYLHEDGRVEFHIKNLTDERKKDIILTITLKGGNVNNPDYTIQGVKEMRLSGSVFNLVYFDDIARSEQYKPYSRSGYILHEVTFD